MDMMDFLLKSAVKVIWLSHQLSMLALVCGLLHCLQGPFSAVVDRQVRDPWLKQLMDLECFVLSGMLAKDTLAAEMVFMFMERGQGKGRIDYPVSGC